MKFKTQHITSGVPNWESNLPLSTHLQLKHKKGLHEKYNFWWEIESLKNVAENSELITLIMEGRSRDSRFFRKFKLKWDINFGASYEK